ncbi:MAG: endopygalactorunase, partial [Duncaniella sp.]|nr:endopygalactorunase [Duncaniella sp.]
MAFGLSALASHAVDGRAWRFSSDSLFVAQGTTYRYTVDTHEGEGLTTTTPNIGELLSGIKTDRGNKYRIVDREGNPRLTSALPVKGDRLQELTPAGKVVREYGIGLKSEALSPRMVLHSDSLRVGVTSDVTLDFFAGQRSPDVTVEILFPPELSVTLDNMTVDVIGRG